MMKILKKTIVNLYESGKRISDFTLYDGMTDKCRYP